MQWRDENFIIKENFESKREEITMKLASAAQMKELDRRAIEERHIPSIDLM